MTDLHEQIAAILPDRYRLEAELGAGGMATVYLAEDTKLGRRVAVKVLRPELAAVIGPDRFLREIRITANLEHPHILPLHDSGEANGQLFYVMPFVDGESLRDRLNREKSIPVDEAIRITQQVSAALDYAHRQGVIHRDIKPENILLKDGEALVADFGIALGVSGAQNTRLTETGLSLGTPYYMSPEQATTPDIDGRSDEYAVACMLHEMLTGNPPYVGPNAQSILSQHMVADPPLIDGADGAHIPAPTQAALRRALAKQPDDRFATIKEFAEALRGAPVSSRPSIPLVAAAALGLIAVGVLATQMIPGGGPSSTGILRGPMPRLAVLGFEHLGPADGAFMAQGITEELINRLGGLQSLEVVSRSSSLEYTDSDLDPAEIGGQLGADFVLDGVLDWSPDGNTVRVRPVLVQASTGDSVWSAEFTRPPAAVVDLHSEMSAQIAQYLDLAVSDAERQALARSATDNPLAYEAYLKGLDVLPWGHASEERYETARRMFQQAANLDPDFAQAWLGLAYAHMGLYWMGYDPTEARLDSALLTIEKARAIAPDLPEVHRALGDFQYRLRQYDDALEIFSNVYAERPNDPLVLRSIGFLWRRQGLFEQGLETLERAMALDPRDAYLKLELAWTYLLLNDLDRSFELIEESRAVNPSDEWLFMMTAIVLWTRGAEGDLVLAREQLESFPSPRSDYPAAIWLFQEMFEGNLQAAVDRVDNLIVPAVDLQTLHEPVPLIRGFLLKQLGNTDVARTQFELAVQDLETKTETNPTDFRMYMALGKALAGLGRHAEAIAAGEQAVRLMPQDRDALLGNDALYGLMRIYAALGEDELALDTMARLMSGPTQYGGFWFTKNPEFASLHEHQRFWTILNG